MNKEPHGTVRDKRLLMTGVLNDTELIANLSRKIEQLTVLATLSAKRHLQDDDWQTIPIQVWVKP